MMMTEQSTLETLTGIVSGEAYGQIAEALAAMVPAVVGDPRFFAHVRGVSEIMPRLRNAVDAANAEAQAAAEAEAQAAAEAITLEDGSTDEASATNTGDDTTAVQ